MSINLVNQDIKWKFTCISLFNIMRIVPSKTIQINSLPKKII